MAAPYIPPKDADLLAWGDNFADLITASPATYGLSAPDAVTVQGAQDDFAAALALATNPTTRTEVTVAAKNTAKLAAIGIFRTYASQIRLNPGVMNSDKLALGLNLPNNTPAPIPAPTTVPLLTFIGATPGQHTLRFADQDTPDSRGKPQNVIGMQLFMAVDTTAKTDPADCSFYVQATKNPFAVTFGAGDAGKIATYFGRWVTRKGLVGPWSARMTATVPST